MNNVIIVTGVTGQDGSHMVDYLLKNTDYKIIGTKRRLSVPNHENINHINSDRFETIYFDLADNESIQNAVRKYKPAYFINFAAQSFVGSSWDIPVSTWNINATGVLHILEAIRNFSPKTRFYNAGTSEEFGDVQYCPQDEKHPLRPRSPYGAAKAGARHLVKVYRESYNLYAIQGWLFNHEGTRRGEEFVTRKITKGIARIKSAIDKGESFDPIRLGNLDAKRDWSDAEDLVEGVWRMLNQEIYRDDLKSFGYDGQSYSVDEVKNLTDYILASNETHSIREFVELAFDSAGIDGVWYRGSENPTDEKYLSRSATADLVVVDEKFFRPAEVSVLHGNCNKIQNELGWKPKSSFKDLVDKMVTNDMLIEQASK